MKKFLTIANLALVFLTLASCKPEGTKVEKVYKGEGTFDSEPSRM